MPTDANQLFSPLQLAAAVGILAFLLSIARNALAIRQMTRPRPDSADLSTTLTRLTTLVEQHDKALVKLEGDCAICKRYQSAEIGKVYNKVDEVAAMVNRLCGKIDMLTQRTIRKA
jgi:hypothetical protein